MKSQGHPRLSTAPSRQTRKRWFISTGVIVLIVAISVVWMSWGPVSSVEGETISVESVSAQPRYRGGDRAIASGRAPRTIDRIATLRPLSDVPLVTMPAVDIEEAMEQVLALEKKRGSGVYRFAEAIDVSITPDNAGQWETLPDGRSIWRLRVSSEGAQSLNFGFLEYRMPDGGRLAVFPSSQVDARPIRDFTARDNEAHGQLWTPILASEEVTLEVVLPPDSRDQLVLKLAKVNHGFRSLKSPGKIGGDTSGSCNIDVACTDDPIVGMLIGAYADQIRSVGAYTLNGVDTCTGALINNTGNDGTPYFLTAEHCGISPGNAPSMVVYFNFENGGCRTPGTAASGGVGDGDLSQFNSGAIYRAESADSDFCLVELDDPIPLLYEVFYAGWNRSGGNDIAVGIHHPAVAEKRISFELDSTVNDGVTHVRVNDWDYGTTEPGSSGSPLFDSNGRIIGDLTGGEAACGNNEYDTYGRISVSWTGSGSAATRLSDWLDPVGTGASTLDGINQDDSLSIDDATIVEGDSGSQMLEFTVSLERQSNDLITVEYATFSASATAGGDFTAASGTLDFGSADVTRTIQIPVLGDTTPEENETFEVRLSGPTSAGVSDAIGIGTIDNDDFITPVVSSPLTGSAFIGTPFFYQITAANTPTSFSITNGPVGMTFNGSTGEISWTPSSAGLETVTIIATNSAGSGSETLTIDVVASILSTVLDTNLGFTVGSFLWLPETGETHDGVDAARSPVLADEQTAYFETQINTPPGGDAISFWWKVSSEEGYDWLRFLVDGERVDEISGDEDWVRLVYVLPGGVTTTLRWEYSKDGSASGGLDAGFIDELALASGDPLPTFLSPVEVFGTLAGSFTFQAEAFGATSFTASNLPPGLSISPSTGLITGTPTTVGSTVSTITAINANGSRQQPLVITISAQLGPALDAELPQVIWSTQGEAAWFRQVGITHDEVDAVESGDVENSQSSTLRADVNFDGAQELGFWWRVSSEEDYDFLTFNVNGNESRSISGGVGWVQVSGVVIPAGSQALSWDFTKDLSESDGSDAGWVDEVSFSYVLGAPGSLVASDGTIPGAVRLTWSAVPSADSYRIFRHTSNDLAAATQIASVASGTLFHDDTAANGGFSYHYWVRAFNAANQLGAPDATDTGFRTSDYVAWAAASGLTGSDAEPTATPFNDGIENLLKFAFNMDGGGSDRHVMTTATGTSGLPLIEVSGEGVGLVLRFEFVRRIGSGLIYSPQISATLLNSSWSDTTAVPVVSAIDSTWERVVVEESLNIGTSPKLFGRLTVISP